MFRKLTTFLLAAAVFTVAAPLGAQDRPTRDDAIALVLSVPEIADGLERLADYQTRAYNSYNAYGIWQVEFQDDDGETVAWAQVQPSSGKVFAWEAYFPANDAVYDEIVPVYQQFVASHPDVRSLIRGLNPDDIYPWWDGGAQAWIAWIGDAGDAIMVAVQFDGGAQDSAENPVLTDLWFPNLPDYDEWWVASSSTAVAVAFQEVEIASALRGSTWTTDAALVDNGDTNIWTVRFEADGDEVASATVDIVAGELLEYSIAD